jgi:hypothetical protein
VAFWTKNTIGILLKPTEERNKYENIGVYKLKCLTCQGLCIRQTGRDFKARYKNTLGKSGTISPKTVYAQHTCVLNTGHEYGNLEDTMDVVDGD